jgi:hypothetical protein
VIVTDSRQPGMYHLEDVMQAGSSQHMQQLEELQKKLSFDDPINIQFTSVLLVNCIYSHSLFFPFDPVLTVCLYMVMVSNNSIM